ncbi:MAG: DapH/DapD/GlmU-related protein [Bacteroidota bacterium]
MKKLVQKLINKFYKLFRVKLYTVLSDKVKIFGALHKHQPVLFKGRGEIYFGHCVEVGVFNSPLFYNTTAYLEVRNENARIKIGNHVKINNNFCLICDKTEIIIGNKVLIGFNVTIIDSDFHSLIPEERQGTKYACCAVNISDNVFIGSDVKIFKGVSIGENTVIAAGSVVTKSFGSNLVVGGNPARQISEIK